MDFAYSFLVFIVILFLRSTTTAIALCAISCEYFEYLGGYDTGMEIWGGENFELTLKLSDYSRCVAKFFLNYRLFEVCLLFI